MSTSRKQVLSAKEINSINSDMRVVYPSELSYQLVEKSRIGKSLHMFLQKSRYLKVNKSVKQLKNKVELVKKKVSNFVKN